MLEYLHLKDWQSHRDTHLEFHPGVNVIVGENNAGKTAIVRALWTLVFNPMGYMKKFRRFKSKTWPTIEIGWKGHTIVRNRNGYILDDKVYKAVRDTIPTPIKELLNLTELNFKTIREDLFFISMAPGARAKLLSKVTGLDMQEFFVGYCTKQIATIKDSIKTQEHLKTQYRKEISELTPVLELEDPIATIDATINELVVAEESFNSIANAYNSILELEDTIDRKEDIEEFRDIVDEASRICLERSELENRLSRLKETVLELQQLEKIFSRRQKMVELSELMDKAAKAVEDMTLVGADADKINAALDMLVEIQEAINETTKKVEELRERKRELLRDMGICPLCETEILQ